MVLPRFAIKYSYYFEVWLVFHQVCIESIDRCEKDWLYQTYTCLICLMLSYGLQMTGKAMCHLLIIICLPFYQRRRYSAITRLWLMFDVQYTSRDTDADRALFCFTIIDYIPDSCVLDALHWRHNEHNGVSNNQPHDCLLNSLFRRRSEKTLKLRGTGLCAGNSPETGEFLAQKAGNAENASIWWHHHVFLTSAQPPPPWIAPQLVHGEMFWKTSSLE